ncbi:MAG: pyridoxamine 5'-phosphate oxidase family protein [Bacteroidales bacterium]
MLKCDEKISTFLKEHNVLTLCTKSDKGAWLAHCFYVFDEKNMRLIFTSDPEGTRHGQEMTANESVAIGIVLETTMVGKVQGVQIEARAFRPEGEEYKVAKKTYTKHYPISNVAKLHIWTAEINSLKMTDNRLGFGKKLHWNRNSSGSIRH